MSAWSISVIQEIEMKVEVIQFLGIVGIVVALYLIRMPSMKGWFGEAAVKLIAKLRLPRKTYHPIHNVTLPTAEGGTTQIDHIFVSRYGIFVVETKHMKGWIYGCENEPQWTQKFHRKSFRFQNPLRQNYKHIKALEAVPGVSPETLHSVIAFTGKGTLKSKIPANVTSGNGYIRYIKSFQTPILSQAQVQAVIAQIEANRLAPSRKTHRQHVAQLKSQRKCPRCGSEMILRIAKRGSKFWGCSAFPKCRMTQDIASELK
jgi:ssDNA-binding Zn-finger/Zn-ribbon topoisomerase 1